jgi:hypothetical protein
LKRHPTTQTDHPVKQKAKGRVPFRDLAPAIRVIDPAGEALSRFGSH